MRMANLWASFESLCLRMTSLRTCKTCTWTKLYFSHTYFAYSDVELPGGPIKMTRWGLRAPLEYLSLRTRAISSRMRGYSLVPSSSVIKPWHTFFTAAMLILFSRIAAEAILIHSFSPCFLWQSSDSKLDLIRSIEKASSCSSKMNLSGMIPILSNEIAWTSVLGNPSKTYDFCSFSSCSIWFLTN